MNEPALRLVAWSDYLCPWCANASVRLYRVADEFPEVEVEWRSYLLRPAPRATPSSRLEAAERLEKFRHYARSWSRPAQEPDAASFRFWESEAAPPTHSLPAQVAAKSAARLGRSEFRAFHERLMQAYFEENRDISDAEQLRSLWLGLGLARDGLAPPDDPTLVAAVLRDHREALEYGASGVRAVLGVGDEAVVVGAQPL